VTRAGDWNDTRSAALMQQLNFELDREFVELNQLLKLSGLCDSGGAGKALVASGSVSVDGVVELRKTCKIRDGQVVRIGDAEIRVTAIPPVA
jgi:ribosome-associated protein